MVLSLLSPETRARTQELKEQLRAIDREMERLGLRPGVTINVEAGTRNASVLVRVGDRTDTVRLSARLATGISVISERQI